VHDLVEIEIVRQEAPRVSLGVLPEMRAARRTVAANRFGQPSDEVGHRASQLEWRRAPRGLSLPLREPRPLRDDAVGVGPQDLPEAHEHDLGLQAMGLREDPRGVDA
jgi:hypothetical protein